MPVERVMVSTRPNFDTATWYASYWVGITLRFLEEMGMRITDLSGDLANKEELVKAIEENDPIAYWGVGHGSETQFAGQDAYVMLEKGVDERLFVGRIVHLTACLTGAEDGLLESIANAGAVATIGYKVELIVGVMTDNFAERPDNAATESLMKPDCAIEMSLAEGKTVVEALDVADSVAEDEIEYWRASGHPDADLVIWALINNRDGLVLYGIPQVSVLEEYPPLHPFNVIVGVASLIALGLQLIRWEKMEPEKVVIKYE